MVMDLNPICIYEPTKNNTVKQGFEELAILYCEELILKEKELGRLRGIARSKAVSLLYGNKNPKINPAIFFKECFNETS